MIINKITKKEFSFKILELLDMFFSDPRGYEMTLFFWPKKQKNLIQNDIHFTWKVYEKRHMFANSSAAILFQGGKFITPFLGCKTEKELSDFISDFLPDYHFTEEEYDNNFSIISGLNLFQNSWQENIQKILGIEMYREYFSTKCLDMLNHNLHEKEFKHCVKI